MPNGLRDVLVRVVAQRLKAWAEAVLAEAETGAESEPARAPVAPRGAAARVEAPPRADPPEPVENEDSEGPPAQWLRDVEALRGGPPADWLRHARRSAAPPRDWVERRNAVRPASAVVEPDSTTASDEAREAEVRRAEPALLPEDWQESAARPPALRGEWLTPPRGSSGRERAGQQPVPSRVEPPGPSVVSPAEAVDPSVARPAPSPEPWVEPRPARPSVAAAPRVEAPVGARRSEEQAPPRAPEPVAPGDAPLPPAPFRRSEPSPPVAALAPLPARPSAPEGNVLPPAPAAPARVSGFEEEASSKRPGPSASPELFTPQDRWPWPELPEHSTSDAADGAVLLLYWERLNRLDREQRGE
ncbi:MAG TPA: hypothetical protein VK539_09745 [Myxococcaceae bacterium]|nr:hypothetical protein [Myxococcaceae bacterium]